MEKIDFVDEELERLRIGECIEKELPDGNTIIVCGKKIDVEK